MCLARQEEERRRERRGSDGWKPSSGAPEALSLFQSWQALNGQANGGTQAQLHSARARGREGERDSLGGGGGKARKRTSQRIGWAAKDWGPELAMTSDRDQDWTRPDGMGGIGRFERDRDQMSNLQYLRSSCECEHLSPALTSSDRRQETGGGRWVAAGLGRTNGQKDKGWERGRRAWVRFMARSAGRGEGSATAWTLGYWNWNAPKRLLPDDDGDDDDVRSPSACSDDLKATLPLPV